MKLTLPLATVIAMMGCAGAVAAQPHPANPLPETITLIGPGSSDAKQDTIIYTLSNNAPTRYNIPGAPRFAIVGNENKFYLGIGGTAKGTISYDFGHPIDNGFDFTTSAIPMTQTPGNGGLVQLSGATSSLYVNFVAMPGSKYQLGVYVNANFTGDNYGFDLQYAYLKFMGFTAGYNYSLFSDMGAAPPSIDNEGPNSFTAIPNSVLDYQRNITKNLSFGVGLEMPMLSATTDSHTATVNQRVPDIPAYLQYSWGGGSSWIRFSGILRNLYYRDVVADRNRDQIGWGVKVSGTASPIPFITAYWQAAYGKGITSYFQDLYEGGMDLVPDSSYPGRLNAVKAWGGYVGLQYNLSKKVFATTTYGHLRTYASDYTGGTTPWGEQCRYTQYALANVMWTIIPQVQCGVEYLYGRRVNMDGSRAHDNRIQAMLQVSF